MKNMRKSLTLQSIFIVSTLALSSMSRVASAQGAALVLDSANLEANKKIATENKAQTAKLDAQYQELKKQYEELKAQKDLMQKNTDSLEQKDYVVGDVGKSIDQNKEDNDVFQSLISTFKDVEQYRNLPCFGGNSCTKEDQAKLQTQLNTNRADASKAQKLANEAVFQSVNHQQRALSSDVQQLQNLQNSVQSAQGQMQAIQYANQLASKQNEQLMQIRQMLAKQQKAEATREQAWADQEAREEVAAAKLRQGEYQKSSGKTW